MLLVIGELVSQLLAYSDFDDQAQLYSSGTSFIIFLAMFQLIYTVTYTLLLSSMGATKAALILIDAHCTRLLGIVRKTDDASATTAFVQNGALQSCIDADRR